MLGISTERSISDSTVVRKLNLDDVRLYMILVCRSHLPLEVCEYVLLSLCIIPERALSQTPTLPPITTNDEYFG